MADVKDLCGTLVVQTLRWYRRVAATCTLVLLATTFGAATRVAAQATDTSYFVKTDHGDTIGIEQEVIAGNTLSGEWIQHQNGVCEHH